MSKTRPSEREAPWRVQIITLGSPLRPIQIVPHRGMMAAVTAAIRFELLHKLRQRPTR